jgi:hypothetical protein
MMKNNLFSSWTQVSGAPRRFHFDLVPPSCIASMTKCRLPQELICAIIDSLLTPWCELDGERRPFDHAALRTCSLVCHAWVPACQRRLFHSISIIPRRCCGEANRPVASSYSTRLGRLLHTSPHLAGYIRDLELWDTCYVCQRSCVEADRALPLVLRKLGNLQKLQLWDLHWSTFTAELRQSLRWVLQLPSVTMLQIHSGRFGSLDDFANFISHARSLTRLVLSSMDISWPDDEEALISGYQEDMEDVGTLDWDKRGRLSELRLMSYRLVDSVHVDWLLGPRSPAEVSHVQTLHIHPEGDAVNRLLRTIGGSLRCLKIHLPRKSLSE